MKLYTIKSSAHRAAKKAGFEKDQYEIIEIDGNFGWKPKAKPGIKRKSDIERPTKAVWHIADEMSAADPQVRRKDVIAECVRRGIAFYTARTQYQQWLAAKRGTTK